MKMTKKKASLFGLAALTIVSVGGFSGCVYGPAPDYDEYAETSGNSVSENSTVSEDVVGVSADAAVSDDAVSVSENSEESDF